MHFDYYRVCLPSLSPALLFQCCFQLFSTVLWYRVLMSLRVNKWSLHLNSSVSCLYLCFVFNPTPKSHIDSSIVNATARSVKPNSPVSKERNSWYSTNRAWVATWFSLDHPSGPDRFSCWKSTSLLHSTNILVCWIPCISSSFSKFLGASSTWGTAFAATTWMTLTPLVIVIWMAIRFFTTTATCLLPVVTSV